MNINRLLNIKFLKACIAACLLSGCASAPIQEMSDARQSLQAAQAAGAGTHALCLAFVLLRLRGRLVLVAEILKEPPQVFVLERVVADCDGHDLLFRDDRA